MEIRFCSLQRAPLNVIAALKYQLTAQLSRIPKHNYSTRSPAGSNRTTLSLASVLTASKSTQHRNIRWLNDITSRSKRTGFRPLSTPSHPKSTTSQPHPRPLRPPNQPTQTGPRPASSSPVIAPHADLSSRHQPIRYLQCNKPSPRYGSDLEPQYRTHPLWKRPTVVYIPARLLELEKLYREESSYSSDPKDCRPHSLRGPFHARQHVKSDVPKMSGSQFPPILAILILLVLAEAMNSYYMTEVLGIEDETTYGLPRFFYYIQEWVRQFYGVDAEGELEGEDEGVVASGEDIESPGDLKEIVAERA